MFFGAADAAAWPALFTTGAKMPDVLERAERACKFVYGRPELVEAAIAVVADTYACTNLFFYVVDNHLEVCATLVHMKEIRKAQFMQGQIPPHLKMRPN